MQGTNLEKYVKNLRVTVGSRLAIDGDILTLRNPVTITFEKTC